MNKLFRSKKVLLGMTLAMSVGVLSGCGTKAPVVTPEPQQPAQIEHTTDVVVVGSGGAGLAAALEVRNAGKEVIILEQMVIVGGNTLRATGGLNAAGTSVQAELEIEDDATVHFEDTMKGGYEKNIESLVTTMTSKAADAIDWLLELGGDFTDVGRLAGATNNRAHRPAGGAPVGPEVVKTLKTALENTGMKVMTETKATEILTNEGVVAGVIAEDKDGNELTIKANAVILATGGFGANPEILVSLNPDLEGFVTTNHAGADGSGIKMAQEIGAGVIQLEEIQTHPTAVPSNGYMITEAVRGNGAIVVNREGNRFVGELETRDVVSKAILEQEGQSAYLVFDQGITDSLSAIAGYIKQGIVTEADTPEGLAEALNMPVENLVATVEKYNGFQASGKDADFGRADMPRALETSKFYAIEIAPAVHHTMGGLAINENAEVLNEDGEIIKGLFAAGEVTGGVHGGNRLGGNALADIVVFGRIAGQNAAK
ncbi:flavocytochrome c [Alkaliphilus sp. B6464]|nr:flavocytochrome c [Alkaliphilus sp. B6464]